MTTTLPRPAPMPRPTARPRPATRPRIPDVGPGRAGDPRRPRGTVCATGSGREARMRPPLPVGWGLAVVAGALLALTVWAMVAMGSVVEESAAPAAQGTTVVHVRSGESLSALARRVAPNQPTARVLTDISALNHLTGAGLTAGQPLLAPQYR